MQWLSKSFCVQNWQWLSVQCKNWVHKVACQASDFHIVWLALACADHSMKDKKYNLKESVAVLLIRQIKLVWPDPSLSLQTIWQISDKIFDFFWRVVTVAAARSAAAWLMILIRDGAGVCVWPVTVITDWSSPPLVTLLWLRLAGVVLRMRDCWWWSTVTSFLGLSCGWLIYNLKLNRCHCTFNL